MPIGYEPKYMRFCELVVLPYLDTDGVCDSIPPCFTPLEGENGLL